MAGPATTSAPVREMSVELIQVVQTEVSASGIPSQQHHYQ